MVRNRCARGIEPPKLPVKVWVICQSSRHTKRSCSLKVLFLSRATLFSVPGGDTVQIMKTAAALRERGCSVDISTDTAPRLEGFDLVHILNLTRPQETYVQALTAKKYGTPIAFSPIYVDYREYERRARTGLKGKLLGHLPLGEKPLKSSDVQF